MKKIIALLGSALLLLALAAVAFVPVASAHAQIISCTPAIGGTVATAPDTLTCKTSEAMDPKASSLAVFDATGAQVDKKDSKVDLNDPDRVTISVSLDTTRMKDGKYTVKWNTLSAADGDSADGEFQFAVGASPIKFDPTATPVSEVTQTAGATSPSPATAAPTAVATLPVTVAATNTVAAATNTTVAATNTTAPTVAPTSAPTAVPNTLPSTGTNVDWSLYILLAVVGALMLGAAALMAMRTRR